MNTTRQEKTIKELFIKECWAYLRDNFHKFNEANKIKVSLTLAQKEIAQVVEASVEARVTEMPAILKSGEATNENRITPFLIGSPQNDPTP